MKSQIHLIHVFLLVFNVIAIRANILEQSSLNKINYCANLSQINSCYNSSNATHRVKIEFFSEVVDNEYLIIFKGYYKKETRENFIKSALLSSGIKDWRIIPRDNFAVKYPSDFDIVHIQQNYKQNGLEALKKHPLVRRVVLQKLVQRSLKYLEEDEDIESEHSFEKNFNNVKYNLKFL